MPRKTKPPKISDFDVHTKRLILAARRYCKVTTAFNLTTLKFYALAWEEAHAAERNENMTATLRQMFGERE